MPPSPHMSQRTVPMKDNSERRVKQLRGEDLHCKCCCDLGLEETMARVPGERAPAFTSEELEKLVDGVLPSTRYSTVLETNRSRTSTSATTSPGPVVPVVTRIWSALATRAASVARSHSTYSPSPVKHQKLASARRERGKSPATKAAPRGTGGSVESAATPSKVGKGHKKLSKSGKSSTAEKTAIIPAAQEPTASTSPAAQEATASTSPAAQEATASTSPAAQEATATSPAAQEATASTSPAAQEATTTSPGAQEATASTIPAAQEATTTSPATQEATASTSPAGQEETASTNPAAQEATASTSPAAQEATATRPAAQEASTSPAAQEATATSPAAQAATAIIPTGPERTASTSPAGPERTASTSPAGPERTASTSPAGP
ncbi:hypothetical protein NDU88_003606 [Pleurodeles waltl]|uniref:Uncharacterized protein n=1 Tax=Pleurodeles waltl TaxID=8319 RepID=A0AAV7TNX5_PLEWA|nr:hypothetical protein NDU88_003606 [Pleurodeles waltl]